jgi:hypothetical protein
MFPDHRGELKTVQFRHANVDQNNGDLVLEQIFERLAPGCRGNKIFSEFL